ncbi:MAG: clpP [Blastococcus sp.]|nr:clpP [Blastococcus sp.]
MAAQDTVRFVDRDGATIGMAASKEQFLPTCGTRVKRFALPSNRSCEPLGKGRLQIEKDSDRHRWSTPDEAPEHGPADHVVAHATALPVRNDPLTD